MSPPFDPPFCILVLGNFRGRPQEDRAGAADADWTPIRVTADNMVELAGLAPRVELPSREADDPPAPLVLRGLEDFHPDTLFRRHPLFSRLRAAREAILEGREPPGSGGTPPASAAEAGDGGPREEGPPGEAAAEGPRAPAGGPVEEGGAPEADGLLDAIVEETSGAASAEEGAPRSGEAPRSSGGGAAEGASEELRSFVREALERHRVPAAPADREARRAAVDRAIGEAMRRVLRVPAFRRLEALWRGVVLLLSQLDAGNAVRVYIADVPRGALERDRREAGDPHRSRLHRLLGSPDLGPASDRWAVAVGAYRLGADDDLPLCRHVAAAARAADVPWFSEADPLLAGCTSLRERGDPLDWSEPWPGAWAELQAAPEAGWLALALPRMLVREPYGPESSRVCRSFGFEELPPGDESRGPAPLPWGNPGLACAAVLGRAFARGGWRFSAGVDLDLSPMPLAPGPGGSGTPALTEARLGRSAAARIAEVGLVPLVSFPYEARIRVGGIRPVGGHAGLRGWWTR